MKDAQARLAQNKKRNRKSNIMDEKRSGGADSRGSTPSDKRGTSSSRAASIASDKGTGNSDCKIECCIQETFTSS